MRIAARDNYLRPTAKARNPYPSSPTASSA